MHISPDQQGVIIEQEDARVMTYLKRFDLGSRSAQHFATLFVERGLVRAPQMTRRVLAEALANEVVRTGVCTAQGWVEAARTVVRQGWVPSKWTQTEVVEEVHVHVHLTGRVWS
jgi:hypothetical protein